MRGVRMRGVNIYWTKGQYWAHQLLLALAFIMFGLRVVIGKFVLSVQSRR